MKTLIIAACALLFAGCGPCCGNTVYPGGLSGTSGAVDMWSGHAADQNAIWTVEAINSGAAMNAAAITNASNAATVNRHR